MLLDSHVIWWILNQPGRLGKNLTRKLSGSTLVLYSAATVLELFQNNIRGKLKVPENLVALINQSGLLELQLTAEQAEQSRHISPEVTDPFDRILLGQAQWQEVDFYTSDMRILSLGLDFVKDASL